MRVLAIKQMFEFFDEATRGRPIGQYRELKPSLSAREQITGNGAREAVVIFVRGTR